jgi:hypothetical protein
MKRDDRLTIVTLSARSRGLFIRMSDPTCAQSAYFAAPTYPIRIRSSSCCRSQFEPKFAAPVLRTAPSFATYLHLKSGTQPLPSDGRNRRIADVADRGLGRLNWADTARSKCDCRTAGPRPEQAFIEAHWTVAKAESGPSLATPVGPSPKPFTEAGIDRGAGRASRSADSEQSLLAASTEKGARRFEATTLLL